jgi:hypothetical protein
MAVDGLEASIDDMPKEVRIRKEITDMAAKLCFNQTVQSYHISNGYQTEVILQQLNHLHHCFATSTNQNLIESQKELLQTGDGEISVLLQSNSCVAQVSLRSLME